LLEERALKLISATLYAGVTEVGELRNDIFTWAFTVMQDVTHHERTMGEASVPALDILGIAEEQLSEEAWLPRA